MSAPLTKTQQVTKLDVRNKYLELDDGRVVSYDKVLIATGGRPKSLPVFDTADAAVKSRVALYRTVRLLRPAERGRWRV